MARRPLPIGTWGTIHVKKIRKDYYRAHGRFRHDDGVTRQHRRTGTGSDDARDNLLELFRELAGETGGGDLDRDSRFRKSCEAWFSEFKQQQEIDGKSPETARSYRYQLDTQVIPRLGELTNREIKARTVDRTIQAVSRDPGKGTAKVVRSVVSNVCLWCVRNDLMDVNPVKSAGKITDSTPAEPVALTYAQRQKLIAGLKVAAEKRRNHTGKGRPSHVWQQLPAYEEALLATGCRPSEVLALSDAEVTEDGRLVTIAWHLVRAEGGGVTRMPGRKGDGRKLTLIVPDWSHETWRELAAAARERGGGPLFPAKGGLYPTPSSVRGVLSTALTEIGFGWVTARTWRKTVAAVLDEAGLSTTEGADQLGNTPAVFEKHYRPPRATNAKAAQALDRWKRNA